MTPAIAVALIGLVGIVLAALIAGWFQLRIAARKSGEAVSHLQGNGHGTHTEMLEATVSMLAGLTSRLDGHIDAPLDVAHRKESHA